MQGDTLDDVYSERPQGIQLVGVIGQQAHGSDAEILQYAGGGRVLPLIGLVAERQVGVDRVQALVLEVVGPQLVPQPNAAALLAQVDQNAGTLLSDAFDRQVELLPTIAAQGTEHIPCEALGMDPDQQFATALDLSQDKGQMLLVIGGVAVQAETELAFQKFGTRAQVTCSIVGWPM